MGGSMAMGPSPFLSRHFLLKVRGREVVSETTLQVD